MRVDDFDFDLPDSAIALRPAVPRDAARLLLVPAEGPFSDLQVRDLPGLLRAGDALVLNDTRVIPAQLEGVRLREGVAPLPVSLTLHKRIDENRWRAFVKGARRLKSGDTLRFGHEASTCLLGTLEARVEWRQDMEAELAFTLSGPALDEAIRAVGHIPLPPYIAGKRPEDAQDRADYQTVFAQNDGSVAAPTAGLHMTPALMAALEAAGVSLHRVTLHVGAGTFLPVKADDTKDHVMHAEWGEVSADTVAALQAVKARGGRIIALGTTALRLLESAARETGTLAPFRGETDIFITPGYQFRVIDGLMTNFHLPRSTLFMLVSALMGLERMKAVYAHALASGYRFYSYGDTSLLWKRA